MAVVNMGNISRKAEKFSKSTVGKAKMKSALEKIRKSDGKTGLGREVLSHAKMAELADELVKTIKSVALSYDLPASVAAHFDSIQYMITDMGSGVYECSIYFTDDLSRESLSESGGDGIRNIVALFNNGYVASSYTYGWWNGHQPTGDAVLRSTDSDAWVRSMIGRPSLNFMQGAISDFMSKYNKYNISVYLNEDVYDGNYAGSPNGYITRI